MKYPSQDWRGSFAIPMTPFDDQDRIDEDVLAGEIEFCIGCNTQGIVVPVLVSEFQALSESERRTMIRVPVEAARGRVPVVANVAAVNTLAAVELARYAQETGANSVIAMPPYGIRPDFDTMFRYFRAIAAAVSLPVWIQNAGIVSLSPDQIIRLCSEIENIRWVKEEVWPPTHSIANLVNQNSPFIHGVMGGSGGRYMITEHARGSRGVVHACEFTDLIQRVWALLDDGQLEAAGDLFEHLLPGIELEGLMGMAFAKEIMVRRGVFKNRNMRMESRPLDAGDLVEIDRVWERMKPYLEE
jgi:dihydrodipicolinate synthase/N-acetylneuraminate lyase